MQGKFVNVLFFCSFLASILSKYLPVKGMYMNETRCFFVVFNYGSTSQTVSLHHLFTSLHFGYAYCTSFYLWTILSCCSFLTMRNKNALRTISYFILFYFYFYFIQLRQISGRGITTALACGPLRATPLHQELHALLFTNSVWIL